MCDARHELHDVFDRAWDELPHAVQRRRCLAACAAKAEELSLVGESCCGGNFDAQPWCFLYEGSGQVDGGVTFEAAECRAAGGDGAAASASLLELGDALQLGLGPTTDVLGGHMRRMAHAVQRAGRRRAQARLGRAAPGLPAQSMGFLGSLR